MGELEEKRKVAKYKIRTGFLLTEKELEEVQLPNIYQEVIIEMLQDIKNELKFRK